MVVTRKQLAEILGLSVRRISQLTNAGVLTNVSRGKYDLRQAIQAYIAYRVEAEQKKAVGNQSLTLAEVKRLKEMVEVELKKMQLRRKKGELLERDELTKVCQTIVANAKTRFLAMPTKIAPLLVGLKNIKKIKTILEKEVHSILEELAKLGDVANGS